MAKAKQDPDEMWFYVGMGLVIMGITVRLIIGIIRIS